MNNTQTDGSLTIWGMFNIVSPLPLILLTVFWCLPIMSVFVSRLEHPLVLGISMLPLCIHPISTISAFVCALRRRKHSKRDSIRCAVLTAIGAAGNILLLLFAVHRASIG